MDSDEMERLVAKMGRYAQLKEGDWEWYKGKSWKWDGEEGEPHAQWIWQMEMKRSKWQRECKEQWLAGLALVEAQRLADWDLEAEDLPQVYAKADEQVRTWLLALSVASRVGLRDRLECAALAVLLLPLLPKVEPGKENLERCDVTHSQVEIPELASVVEAWQWLAKNALEKTGLPSAPELMKPIVAALVGVQQGAKVEVTVSAIRRLFGQKWVVMSADNLDDCARNVTRFGNKHRDLSPKRKVKA